METVKAQSDKLIVLLVLLASFGMLFFFRGEHDPFVFMSGVVTTVLGGLLGMVQGGHSSKDQTDKVALDAVGNTR